MLGGPSLLGIFIALLLPGPEPCGGKLGGAPAPFGWPWVLSAELWPLRPLDPLMF
jgi:hypothetical protein